MSFRPSNYPEGGFSTFSFLLLLLRNGGAIYQTSQSHMSFRNCQNLVLSLLVSSKFSYFAAASQLYELPIIPLCNTLTPYLFHCLLCLRKISFFFSWEKFRLKECLSSLFGSSSIASASLVFLPLLCWRRVHGWLATEGWLTERAGNQPAGVGDVPGRGVDWKPKWMGWKGAHVPLALNVFFFGAHSLQIGWRLLLYRWRTLKSDRI